MLQLYLSPNSICTQKVLITLDEKKIDFEQKIVNLFANEQYDPEYLKLNPKGVVPTLIHDGRAIPESTLICEFLDETYPDNPLIPDDPYLKTRMRLWSKQIDEHIFAASRELSFSGPFRARMKSMTEEQRQERFDNVGDPDRRARYISTFELGTDSPYILQAVADYEKVFKAMEAALDEFGPWLLGADFSLADINMIPYVARLHYMKILDIWIAERPLVKRWWARAQERPSVIECIASKLMDEDIANMGKYGTEMQGDIARIRTDYLAGTLK
ncbi:MAG: glutathione S-transferase family protein [Rhodospirillales bacterium]|nr:glutathione S-transferase family protein [Rhodospirillales bacterium]